MPDHHARLAIEARQAADDRQVVGKGAVAVQFVEIGKDLAHVVQRIGALGVAGDLRNLPRGQVGIDVFGQLLALAGQPRNLFGNIDSRIVLHEAQFFDLCLEFGNGLLKIQEGGFHKITRTCL